MARRRRRNPMSNGVKVLLGMLAAAAAAGIGYAIVQRRKLKELADIVVPGDLRLPRPDFAVHLPTEPEDYAVISEVVCECTSEWVSPGQVVEDADALLAEIQRCSAEKLMPDFPWPPISGDHSTVQTLWSALGYEASRHMALNLCPVKPPAEPAKANPRRSLPQKRETRRGRQ